MKSSHHCYIDEDSFTEHIYHSFSSLAIALVVKTIKCLFLQSFAQSLYIKVLHATIGAKIMVGCSLYILARFGEMTTMATCGMKYSCVCSFPSLFDTFVDSNIFP